MANTPSVLLLVYLLTLTVIAYLIYIPYAVYLTWKYYGYRSDVILTKRYWKVVIIQNAFLMLLIISAMSVPFSFPLIGLVNFHIYFVFVISGYGFVYSFITRLWLNFFAIQYDEAMHQHEWSYLLNHTHTSPDDIEASMHHIVTANTSCFVKHRGTLGNDKYVSKIAFVAWFISSIIAFLVTPPYKTYSAEEKLTKHYQTTLIIKLWLQILCISVPVLALIVIRCKTPIFHDHLWIRHEIKRILYGIAGCLFSLCVFIVIYIIVELEWIEDMCTITVYFTFCSVSMFFMYTSTQGILCRMQPNRLRNTSISTASLSVHAICANEQIFYEFVEHIRHEFSLELLLCFYEMMWFKHCIKANYPDLITVQNAGEIIINFHEALAKPHQVYKTPVSGTDENAAFEQLKDSAYYLFARYVKEGSFLEINISGPTRHQYEAFFINEQAWKQKSIEQLPIRELYGLYEEIIHELYVLLTNTCNRFHISEALQSSISLATNCSAGSS